MEKVKFVVKRSDGEKEFQWQTYEVALEREGMTVLDGLFWLVDNHEDAPAFRYTCRSAVCGSCAMMINGKNRLACKTQIRTLKMPVKIEPLPGLEVIKDMVVNMSPFFSGYELVKPYLIRKNAVPKKEILQTIAEREKIDEATICIMCAACSTSCPIYWSDNHYIGPAALLKAYRFIVDSRDDGRKEHLEIVKTESGVWRCRTAFRCTDCCPKNIQITKRIQELKRFCFGRK